MLPPLLLLQPRVWESVSVSTSPHALPQALLPANWNQNMDGYLQEEC